MERIDIFKSIFAETYFGWLFRVKLVGRTGADFRTGRTMKIVRQLTNWYF